MSIPFAFPFLSLIALAAPGTPTFTCVDGDGANYQIWLTRDSKRMQIREKGGTVDIPLADANYGRPPQPAGQPLHYNGWNKKAPEGKERLQMAHEFSTYYVTNKGSSRVIVSIVVDHAEKLGLSCRTNRNAVVVVPLEKEGGAIGRYVELARDAGRWRSSDGRLWPTGALGVEAALRRFGSTANFKKPADRAKFIEDIGETVKRIHPESVKIIGESLPAAMQEFWKNLLAKTQYVYFPEVQRYTAWVQEGAAGLKNNDFESILAGFNSFTASAGFKEKDIRDFFIKEVTPVLKSVTDEQANQIKGGLQALGQTFFQDLWTKAAGKLTLSDFPDIESMNRSIAAVISNPEFEPEKIAGTISAFLKTEMAMNADARKMFIESAGAQIKALTPRQREDVWGWLEPAEKEFFAELLK